MNDAMKSPFKMSPWTPQALRRAILPRTMRRMTRSSRSCTRRCTADALAPDMRYPMGGGLKQVQEQHLFPRFHGAQLICDVLNGQRTLRQRLEQSRLLLFVEQPLKSTFFEHPILASTLMLRGHRRPESRV